MHRTGLLFLALALTPIFPATARAGGPDTTAIEERDEDTRQQEAYEAGTDALDEGKWERAVTSFTRAAGLPGDRTDGALYWKAYALNKLGRRDDALATLADLSKRFPGSRWGKDARSLEAEVRQAGGSPSNPAAESDEDFKLMAINSLMSSDPEQAVPMLEKVLNGNSSPKLKERALFVLAQSGSPRARQVVTGIAKGQSNPYLQEKAIKYLGLFGGEQSRQALSEIYASSTDVAIKERILHSFMTSGDKARLLAAAKNEKDPKLRATAVHELGVSGGRDELWQLYQSETSTDVKMRIIHALFLSGDGEHLGQLAKSEKQPELRIEAIHRCGLLGKDRTGTALVALYKGEKDTAVKEAAIHALFLQNNGAGLVELARAETNRELKTEIVHKLSLMNSKEGTDYLMEILSK
jgi:HEAT repeat protein